MAAAGLGDDLLLANESLDLGRLTSVIESGTARITVAVDSEETIAAAAQARVPEVLIDVNVGHAALRVRAGGRRPAGRPRPLTGPRGARRDGLRGPPHARARRHQGRPGRARDGRAARGAPKRSAATSCPAAARAPGTSTRWVTELQAGVVLPDGHRVHAARVRLRERPVRAGHRDLEERPAGACSTPGSRRSAWTTATRRCSTWATAGSCPTSTSPSASPTARHGRPSATACGSIPAHVDPTVSQHERLHVIDGDEVVEVWDVDLRGW